MVELPVQDIKNTRAPTSKKPQAKSKRTSFALKQTNRLHNSAMGRLEQKPVLGWLRKLLTFVTLFYDSTTKL